jgi:Carboxypeptidase regulatory-like domain/TonB dependent receptor/TonB-dependent Receptor Plug Domain
MEQLGSQVRVKALLCLPFLMLSIASAITAQTVNGNLLGTVLDQQQAAVADAQVSSRNVDTGAMRTTTTDATGSYRIASVPAGTYEITVGAAGFTTQVRSAVTVTVGADVRVDFALSVGAVQQQVQVTGEVPQVDTTSSTLSGVVAENTVRQLPLNGRDWLQLATLQPGVLTVETQSRGATGGMGTKMSISGGRPSHNAYRIDGMVVNDHSNNSPGSILGVNLGVDAIREFSVLTSDYSAEYGRAAGGVINAITMSGTNAIHGTAFEFLRNSALDARNFFDGATVPPFRRNQFGGTVGGPIKKNKVFFFANYEGLRQFLSESFTSQTLSPNARNGLLTTGPVVIDPRVKPYLALYPVPNATITGDTGFFNFGAGVRGSEDYVTGRIDYTLSANDTLSSSYTFDNGGSTTPDPFDEKLERSESRNQRFMLSFQHVFSPTLLNTIRTGFTRTAASGGFDVSPNIPQLTDPSLGFLPDTNMGTIDVVGLSSPGGIGSTGSDIFWYTAPQVNDDLSWEKGRNAFRFGFSLEALRNNENTQSNPAGNWAFGSIHDFLTVVPDQFQGDFPGTNSYRGVRTKIFGAYIQDDFRFRKNLTLNLGIRYEMGTTLKEVNNEVANLRNLTDSQVTVGNPLYLNPTKRNFAPRFGLAWDPFGDGKTAIRSGFGIFDIVPVPNLLTDRITRSEPFFEAGILRKVPSFAFPNSVAPLLSIKELRTVYVEYKPHPAYTMQWNLNIQRQVTRNLTAAVAYVGSRSNHLPVAQGDLDVVPLSLVTVAPDGHLLFPLGTPQRINPNFSEIDSTQWYGWDTYHSLQTNVLQRFGHGITFQAVYAWSKNIDIGSSELGSSEEQNSMDNPYPFDPNLQRGVTDFDIPQHVSINFSWDVPSLKSQLAASRFLLQGWQLGGIFTAQSGTPFSVVVPADIAGTGSSGVTGHGGGQRPDYNLGTTGCPANGDAINIGNPDQYINLQCFSFPKAGELGNVGRNTLRGPGLEDFDFSLFKNTNVHGEKYKIQFRAEFFNVLNRSNFEFRMVRIFNKNGALVPANAAAQAPTVNTSRQIQFGLKFVY